MSANNGNDVEKRLWAVADQLWANSGLRPADFSAPVLVGITPLHEDAT